MTEPFTKIVNGFKKKKSKMRKCCERCSWKERFCKDKVVKFSMDWRKSWKCIGGEIYV